MDSATRDLFHQKIKEFVYDEEKVVTCTSLAVNLKIPLHEAKSLLMTFVKDCRELKPHELCPTFLISGNLKNNQGMGVFLVKEENLEKQKCLFHSLSSEFIYSIQKGENVDFNIIAIAEQNDERSSSRICPGYVVSKNCIKRTLKNKSLPVPQTTTTNENISFFKKNLILNNDEKQENSKPSNTHSHSQQKQVKPSNKSTGNISNLFFKMAAKTNETKPKIANTEFIENKTVAETEKVDALQETILNGNTKEMSKNDDLIFVKMDEENQPIKLQNDNKKRKKKSKHETPNKKRKRIQEICDSDSSDMFSDEENEDIIEKSDEEPEPVEIIKSNPTPPPPQKNKKRKAVDRVYKDEDGYMVTTTEYVYEDTASEDEEKPELMTTKNIVEKPKVLLEKKNTCVKSESDVKNFTKGKKNKKPLGGKQPTLMSFFKKN